MLNCGILCTIAECGLSNAKPVGIFMLLVTIIMHILLYAFIVDVIYVKTVLGLEIERRYQVDLIDGLNIFNSTYDGLLTSVGIHTFSPAILLQGENRNLRLSDDVYERATKLLQSNNEFTLLATVQQEEKNAGSIIAFSEGNNRFLELQSSARKDEIRLHYTHKDSVYVEIFPYRLADGRWHRLAMTISGNHVTILVDCNRIYERVIKDVNRAFSGRNLSLWLGQRNSRHFYFKGGLQDVKIVGKEHGYLMQCPHLDTECPTCGQFRQLQMSVVHLENYIKELTDRLGQAENRISVVEQCECQKSCRGNGSLYADGAVWRKGCDICSCVQGEIRCRPIQCPQSHCKNPVNTTGECCPACLEQCLFNGVFYDHGEQTSPKECFKCTCYDGSMKCVTLNPELYCPKLTCPEADQFSVPGECCKFCPGVDYCAQGHNCHVNASCLNLRTRYVCQCKMGFYGDGSSCQDVDECAKNGGHDGHHCQKNTKCVNIMGSYTCECHPGYTRVDTFNCAEHDECRSGDHQCHKDAVCINTAGSYHCQCKTGYEGDGFSCEPVCPEACLNGGKCNSPGVCSCRRGFVGHSCEIDVDECSLGIHQCHPNSKCVNLPGWYYCECKEGYYSFLQDNNMGVLCQDIDECEDGSHTCHGTAMCINTDGSFHCQCRTGTGCSLNCIHNGVEWNNGSVWSPNNNTCTKCTCQSGFASCERDPCDCSNPNVNLDCCPHCDRTSRCQHQERPTIYENGQRWIYQCQLCECLYGSIDCWPIDCPPPNCDNPRTTIGDCCPRCDDDPCSTDDQEDNNGTRSTKDTGCTYMGQVYRNGDYWETSHDHCTTCKCKNGHLCCTFSTSCANNVTAPNTGVVSPGSDVQVRSFTSDVPNTEVSKDLGLRNGSGNANDSIVPTNGSVVMKNNTAEYGRNIYLNGTADFNGTIATTEVLNATDDYSNSTMHTPLVVDRTSGSGTSGKTSTTTGKPPTTEMAKMTTERKDIGTSAISRKPTQTGSQTTQTGSQTTQIGSQTTQTGSQTTQTGIQTTQTAKTKPTSHL